jgi:hypothetical protein
MNMTCCARRRETFDAWNPPSLRLIEIMDGSADVAHPVGITGATCA